MPRAAKSRTVTLQHQRSSGKRLTYTIEASQSGSYRILLGDKMLWVWSDPGVMAGVTQPSPELEQEAIQSAISRIESLRGMPEE